MNFQILLKAGRWIFGGFYAAVGVWIALSLLGSASPPPQPTPAAAAFAAALTASGFVDPLLAFDYVVGGLALFARRSAPLGIVLLAPAVVVIFLFHINLSGQWLWGTVNLIWLAALAWGFRAAFSSLWNAPTGVGA